MILSKYALYHYSVMINIVIILIANNYNNNYSLFKYNIYIIDIYCISYFTIIMYINNNYHNIYIRKNINIYRTF